MISRHLASHGRDGTIEVESVRVVVRNRGEGGRFLVPGLQRGVQVVMLSIIGVMVAMRGHGVVVTIAVQMDVRASGMVNRFADATPDVAVRPPLADQAHRNQEEGNCTTHNDVFVPNY